MGIELNNEQILTVYKCENWFRHGSQQVFEIAGAAGTGKAQPIDTKIPTPSGTKLLGDLQVGDYVFNKNKKPVKVLGVFDQGKLDTYKITLSDDRSTMCNDEHLWSVLLNGKTYILTLKEIINRVNQGENLQNFYVPVCTYSGINKYRSIKNIEVLNIKTQMRCIYIDDPDHLYITENNIVTHNTTIVLYLIEKLGLRLDEVLFLAYQGKAACRMMMNGLPARTIHSAIYRYEKVPMTDSEGRYLRNERGKIKQKGIFVKREYIGEKEGLVKLIVVDEAGMVNGEIGEDLKSFKVPIIVLGDLNQLPPVFGKPYFLNNPDIVLTKIMRQNEDNPIIYLSQQVLAGNQLNIGIYGKSAVLKRSDINDTLFSKADIVLTETNRLRWNINNYFREELRKYKQLDYPHNGEKIICRKNNWKKSIDNGIYLTNGMSGYVDTIYKYTYDRKAKTMAMDFRPDFTNSIFKDITFNYEFMYSLRQNTLEEQDNPKDALNDFYNDRFEFGYAITCHISQGSQFNRVLYLNENIMRTKEDQRKLTYTAITRAIDSINIVI